MEKKYVYVFLREDLHQYNSLYPAIQLGHAVYELARGMAPDFIARAHTIVVIGVPDEKTMYWEIIPYIKALGLHHHAFFEPDHGAGFTAVAVEPIGKEMRVHFKSFKLYRESFWTKLKALFQEISSKQCHLESEPKYPVKRNRNGHISKSARYD